MMRRVAILLIVAILLAGPRSIQASDRSYLTLGIGKTSIHKPEIVKRHAKHGYNAFAGVGFDFTPYLSAHIVGEYHWGSAKTPAGDWWKGTVKVKCAFLWLKLSPYRFGSRFVPYAIAGVGYAYLDRHTSTEATTYGFGADVWFTPRIGAFIEGRHVKTYFDEGHVEGRPLKIGLIYLLRE